MPKLLLEELLPRTFNPTGVRSGPRGAGVGGVSTANLDPVTAEEIARSVTEIPFDDSIDGVHPLECFFQMPSGVLRVRSAKVWIQQKSFRQYVSGSSFPLTPGIYETAATGVLAVYVADDGVTYPGTPAIAGASMVTALEITPGLTSSPGDKRLKITGTALSRVQVLIVLDLVLQLGG